MPLCFPVALCQSAAGGGGGGAWSPASLGSQLKGWWDASLETPTGAIGTVTDRSGNSLTMTQSNGTFKPSCVSAVQNSLNVLRFSSQSFLASSGVAPFGS